MHQSVPVTIKWHNQTTTLRTVSSLEDFWWCQLLHPSLPAHCTRASLSDASLSWTFAECTLSDCSPLCSCVCLTHFQHTGALWAPRKSLCSTKASARQLTIPFCYHSSRLLFLLKVPDLPFCRLAKGPHVWGLAGDRNMCQYWRLIRPLLYTYHLLSFSLSCCSPCRGPRPLLERVWWSTVNICV